MEDLEKTIIAPNGQWSLVKAAKITQADMMRMLEQFKAKKDAPAPPLPPARNSGATAGLRTADTSKDRGETYNKEQVARMRQNLPPEVAALVDKATSQKPELSSREKTLTTAATRQDSERAKDEHQAVVTGGRKQAWSETAKFLAQHGGETKGDPTAMGRGYGTGESVKGGNKGWAQMNTKLEQDKLFAQARATGKVPDGLKRVTPTKVVAADLTPPLEMVRDTMGNSSMKTRVGRFNNEGATTRGKIGYSRSMFQTKNIGEDGKPIMAPVTRAHQEMHHWSWDHNNKKWNHVKTIKAAVENVAGRAAVPETSRPKASSPGVLFPKFRPEES